MPLEEVRERLLRWFDVARRELPWRRGRGVGGEVRLDPYAVLVSEAMLQQTQVATVVPYFERWMGRFPTVGALAAAEEQEVLRHWQGLGYYNRARNLHKAAKVIVGECGGRFPETVEGLRALPGVGPYTAGAVASIAFEVPAAIVDGNVQRVLCRLDGVREDPRTPGGQARLWERAGALVGAGGGVRAGDLNSAVMELGATVCSPRGPQCLLCPVAGACEAREMGVQGEIPPAKVGREVPQVVRQTYCLGRPDGTYLLERRPETGRWAGLWQFPTIDPEAAAPPVVGAEMLGEVCHRLTHRRYTFRVYWARVAGDYSVTTERVTAWTALSGIGAFPLSKPQLAVAALVGRAVVAAAGGGESGGESGGRVKGVKRAGRKR